MARSHSDMQHQIQDADDLVGKKNKTLKYLLNTFFIDYMLEW